MIETIIYCVGIFLFLLIVVGLSAVMCFWIWVGFKLLKDDWETNEKRME